MDMSSSSSSNMSPSPMMDMSQMRMTFYTSSLTPLYSSAWAPTSTATYAGTCVFLILLATLFRLLLAYKAFKESLWLNAEYNRRYVVVVGKPTMAERLSADAGEKKMAAAVLVSENGAEEEVMVVQKRGAGLGGGRPWRWSVDPVRAGLDTVVVGVAYLLMLAVMTMNVGYFMSVLGGTFLGSLAVGRYIVAFEHDH